MLWDGVRSVHLDVLSPRPRQVEGAVGGLGRTLSTRGQDVNHISMVACLLICASCASTTRFSTAEWEPLDTGSEASLRGVCAVGNGVVWASGSGGTVLRSVDGGATWTSCSVPAADRDGPNDIRDIEALDDMRAWVISITKPARILRTVDGGVTWTQVHGGSGSSFYDSLALFDDGRAVVYGDPVDGVFDVVRSDDGVRWRSVSEESLPAAREGEAGFAASGTCVVTHGERHAWIGTGGGSARVLRSTDAGRTWRASETPMRQGGETTGIYSVAFRSARDGVIVGGQYDEPELGGDNAAWTDDGGETWHASTVPPAGYRSGVTWIPSCGPRLVAVGRGGCSMSYDSGRTWTSMPGDDAFYAVSAAHNGDTFAVGANGRAARLVRH